MADAADPPGPDAGDGGGTGSSEAVRQARQAAEDGYGAAARLVEAAQAGDAEAWAALIERFQALVYSIPREKGLPEEDCREVFQATWAALHQRLPSLRSPRVLPSWIQTTAARIADRVRRKTQRAQGLDPEDLPLEAPDATPEEEVARHELRAVVHSALGELSPRCSTLLQRLFLDGDEPSYQSVSEELGLPVGSIGPTRSRCLAQLLEVLRRRGIEP